MGASVGISKLEQLGPVPGGRAVLHHCGERIAFRIGARLHVLPADDLIVLPVFIGVSVRSS